jgi:hypothetical protein
MVLDHMPKFSMSFSIDDAALPIFDKVRDTMTRLQFFHHASQLGLWVFLT